MATLIEHSDILDLRDLADLARDILDNREDGTAEGRNTLDALGMMLEDLGVHKVPHVELPDALEDYANDIDPTLIAESYFVTYAQELAEDIGALDPDARWPYSCIDWEKAANELRMDYSEVRLDGHDYLIRS